MEKRAIISILFAFIALVNSIMLFLAFSNFKTQQAEIAAKYCENQERTDFDCGGQCYFMKKMAAAENGSQPLKTPFKVALNFSPFIIEGNQEFEVNTDFIEIRYYTLEQTYSNHLAFKVFHPPQDLI